MGPVARGYMTINSPSARSRTKGSAEPPLAMDPTTPWSHIEIRVFSGDHSRVGEVCFQNSRPRLLPAMTCPFWPWVFWGSVELDVAPGCCPARLGNFVGSAASSSQRLSLCIFEKPVGLLDRHKRQTFLQSKIRRSKISHNEGRVVLQEPS